MNTHLQRQRRLQISPIIHPAANGLSGGRPGRSALLLLALWWCGSIHIASAAVEARFSVPLMQGGTREIVADYLSPPGRLVNIGTHRIHLFCLGTGKPTVVLDAGLGGFSLEWLKIQTDLSHEFRICSYDRAGYGWSDPGPQPRTGGRLAAELTNLLQAAGESPPYLLVGHSFGGYVVQHFAKMNGHHTAGLVLVDSSHPLQSTRLPAQKQVGEMNVYRQVRRYVIWGPVHEHFPFEARTLAYHFMRSRKATRTRRYEWSTLPRSGVELAALGPLPNVPTVVLTRGDRVWPSTALGNSMEATWQELQRDLVSSAPYAMQTVVPYSGHHIHLDQPWIVEDAIRSVARIAECRMAANVKTEHVVLYFRAPTEC